MSVPQTVATWTAMETIIAVAGLAGVLPSAWRLDRWLTLILDAHLDLAMNALEWNRDLTRPIDEIRARVTGLTDKPDRGRGTVSFAEMRRGRVGLCVATQIARYAAPGNPLPGHSQEQAWAMTQGQLAWYRAMEERGELGRSGSRGARSRTSARQTAGARRTANRLHLSLEGADSIVTLATPGARVRDGLRAVGPAHYGPGVYAQGTHASGGLGARGRELLREMERLGIILDVTHLCDESFRDALDPFPRGRVWASHSNCRSLVPDGRQFSDEQIRELIPARCRHRRGVRRVDARARLGGGIDARARRRHARDRRRSHRSRLSDRRQRAVSDPVGGGGGGGERESKSGGRAAAQGPRRLQGGARKRAAHGTGGTADLFR